MRLIRLCTSLAVPPQYIGTAIDPNAKAGGHRVLAGPASVKYGSASIALAFYRFSLAMSLDRSAGAPSHFSPAEGIDSNGMAYSG